MFFFGNIVVPVNHTLSCIGFNAVWSWGNLRKVSWCYIKHISWTCFNKTECSAFCEGASPQRIIYFV